MAINDFFDDFFILADSSRPPAERTRCTIYEIISVL